MNKRLSILAMVFAILLGTFAPVPAYAETTLGAQVLQSDLTLTKANSPYVVNGLIQIPAGKVLVIEPGAVVTFVNGGGIKSLGEVRVGSINSTERVTLNLKTNLDFIGNGLTPPNVSIARTDIYGQNSFLVYGCGKLQIDESYLEKISSIVREQECDSLSLKNSYLNSVTNVYQGFFDGHPSYFVMQNNMIVSMQAICCSISDRTMGVAASQGTYIYNVSNNEFKNLENLNIPYGYINYTFTNNNLTNVKNVKIVTYFGYIPNSKTEVISSNYWGGLTSDSAIRSAMKVVDGKSDIAVQRTIVFEPVATSPVVLVGFPMTKQMSIVKAVADKAAADKAIADKAAAELKAKQEADAKAAAELKAKQEAEAKAAAELKAKQEADAKAAAELKAKQEADAKAAAELKAKQEAEAKAAAELKAKQDAEAKAAAELKAKQDADAKAAADKVALNKAQNDLAEARTALADSQKVNREQAARITSFEQQFKVLSESVNALQSQVTQLNTKLVAALSGLNSANSKIKKICAAKPKPKGC